MNTAYTIGLDFGTDSVRAIIADCMTGEIMASSEAHYTRWMKGMYCDASDHQFRQHPQDYIESMTAVIRGVLHNVNQPIRNSIKGLTVTTTGSTPVAVDQSGHPLSLRPDFMSDPDAMFLLWKDHTAMEEAALINQKAKATTHLQSCGGLYSSEWYWAKLLHILRRNEKIKNAAAGFVEHSDWMAFLLTGGKDISQLKRNVCAAGHKALWTENKSAIDFIGTIDPLLKIFTDQYPLRCDTAGGIAGKIDVGWAGKLGLDPYITIGVGALDAHVGAVGASTEPYVLSKVMGTSTCDMMIVPQHDLKEKYVRGICGQVKGSIIPGMIGLEAGQSAFGDVYAWYENLLTWAAPDRKQLLDKLAEAAKTLPCTDQDPLATDWFNGRRSPDVNPHMTASISGLHLGIDAPMIYRALVEATCFGARAINERFLEEGVPVKSVRCLGGIAQKSPFVVQTLSDALQIPVQVAKAEQACALGAAMFASVSAGVHPDIATAIKVMGHGVERTYYPDRTRKDYYDNRFDKYTSLAKQQQPDIITDRRKLLA
ncbi:MAG: ribulokinase [Bacteroidota bacterium]